MLTFFLQGFARQYIFHVRIYLVLSEHPNSFFFLFENISLVCYFGCVRRTVQSFHDFGTAIICWMKKAEIGLSISIFLPSLFLVHCFVVADLTLAGEVHLCSDVLLWYDL